LTFQVAIFKTDPFRQRPGRGDRNVTSARLRFGAWNYGEPRSYKAERAPARHERERRRRERRCARAAARAPAGVSFGAAFAFWLKLGCVSFGGPAGQIAIMHG